MQQIGVLEALGYRSKEISLGVAGYGKGGDVNHNHAYLLVAPGEQISVSVLSNGGSSTLNALVAEAIMDVCLEEKGIHFQEEEKVSHEILLEIPDSYDSLAGIYVARNDLAGGDGIKRISFPEHKYMHVESISAINISYEDYVLTTDGRFAELVAEVEDSGMEEMRIAMNPDLLTFVTTKSGKTMIACEGKKNIAGIGSYEEMTYVGEKLVETKSVIRRSLPGTQPAGRSFSW